MTDKQLPEAPASVNLRATTEKGWNLQITLRDWDEFALMDRLGKLTQWLEGKNVTPQGQPTLTVSQDTVSPDLPPDDPGWCKLHNVGMKHRENETGEWWSHKYGDGWCNGKES